MLVVIVMFYPLFEAFVVVDMSRWTHQLSNNTLIINKFIHANRTLILNLLPFAILFFVYQFSFSHEFQDRDNPILFLAKSMPETLSFQNEFLDSEQKIFRKIQKLRR